MMINEDAPQLPRQSPAENKPFRPRAANEHILQRRRDDLGLSMHQLKNAGGRRSPEMRHLDKMDEK
jgi:hypothetical protein